MMAPRAPRLPRPRSTSAAASCALALGLVLATSCSRPPADEAHAPEEVLARVGGVEITAGDLARRAASLAASGRTAADPETLLLEMVEREALAQRAAETGLEEDPEVREMIRDVLISQYKERELAPRLEAAAAVSDEELREAYEESKDELTTPERIRLAVLYLRLDAEAPEEEAAEKRRRLESARAAALESGGEAGGGGSQSFGALAVGFSEDQESRYRGGEIGWVERGRHPARIDPAAVEAGFSLEAPGELSEVVAGRDGLYLVRLLERQEAAPLPFEQAAPGLTRRLQEQKQARLLDEFQSRLHAELRVEVHSERLPREFAGSSGAAPPPSLP